MEILLVAVANSVFNIVSKFHFEVGGAIIGTNKLTKSVDGLNKSLEQAQTSIKTFALGGALNLTGAEVGLLGFLRKSVRAADELHHRVLDITQILTANKKLIGGDSSFGNVQNFGRDLLKNIGRDALNSNLNADDLADAVTKLLPVMWNKGIAGDGLDRVTRLAKGIEQSKDILSLGHYAVPSAMNMLEGVANPQGLLWRRLKNETQTFKDMTPGQFKSLKPGQRADKLITALEEVNKNSDVFAERMNSVSGQLNKLTGQFTGFYSVLVPIGDALGGTLIDSLKQINSFVDKTLRPILENFGDIIGSLMPKSLRGLYIQFKKLTKLSEDWEKANTIALVSYISWEAAMWIGMKRLTGGFGVLGKALASVGVFLAPVVKWFRAILGPFAKLSVMIPFLLKSIASYTALSSVVFVLKRILTAAKAMGDLRDAERFEKSIKNASDKIGDLRKVLMLIISPFSDWIDKMASGISKFFSYSYYIEKFNLIPSSLTSKLVKVAEIFSLVIRMVIASFESLNDILNSPAKFVFSGGKYNPWDDIKKNYTDAFSKHNELKEHLKNKDVSQFNLITNIGKVEMKNQFKENVDADRVAVTIKEQLIGSALAPQSSGFRSQVLNPSILPR